MNTQNAVSFMLPLTAAPKKRKILVVDLEAWNWVNEYAAACYDGTTYREWVHGYNSTDCIGDLLAFIMSNQYAGHWIYAHNGGRYDYLFVLKRLQERIEGRGRTHLAERMIAPAEVQETEIQRLDREYQERSAKLKSVRGPQPSLLKTAGPQNRKIDLIPVGSGIAKMTASITDDRGETKVAGGQKLQWSFYDSYKLAPKSLEKLGKALELGGKHDIRKALGLDKDTDNDTLYRVLALPENREVMRTYLKRDCVLTYDCIDKLQKLINKLGGQVQMTLAATAMDIFRRGGRGSGPKAKLRTGYQQGPIWINKHREGCTDPNDSCAHNFIRESLHGGRVEVFTTEYHSGDGGHAYMRSDDVCSMYPAMMLRPMPTGAMEHKGPCSVDELNKLGRSRIGFIRCDVEIPDDVYLPPLPYVDRTRDNKLIFPVGTMRGQVWDKCELDLLPLVGGKITRVYESQWYRKESVFVRFIRDIYKYRENKHGPGWTEAMDFVAKIIMNSVYGKFAMREMREQIMVAADGFGDFSARQHIASIAEGRPRVLGEGSKGVPPNTLYGYKARDLDSGYFSKLKEVSAPYVVPQISAHTTALARVHLFKILYGIVNKRDRRTKELVGGRIYYTDTDCAKSSGVNLKNSNKLGGLKLEYKIRYADYAGAKLYLEEDLNMDAKGRPIYHAKAKGFTIDPSDSFHEWSLIRHGAEHFQERMAGLKESLAGLTKGMQYPRRVDSSRARDMETGYNKRLICKDGINTRPVRVDEPIAHAA